MKKGQPIFITLLSLLLCQIGYAGKGSWLFIPALVIQNGSDPKLGSGISMETLIYGKVLAGGLSVQTVRDEYLETGLGGYLKLMGRLGFGVGSSDNNHAAALYVGGSYGVWQDDYGANISDHLLTTGWGVWLHVPGGSTALDLSLDYHDPIIAGRVAVTVFYVLSLNLSVVSGPTGGSSIYFYPGFSFRAPV